MAANLLRHRCVHFRSSVKHGCDMLNGSWFSDTDFTHNMAVNAYAHNQETSDKHLTQYYQSGGVRKTYDKTHQKGGEAGVRRVTEVEKTHFSVMCFIDPLEIKVSFEKFSVQFLPCWYLQILFWKCPQINVTGWLIVTTDNGLVPSGNKSFPEQMLEDLCRQIEPLGYSGLITLMQ